MTGTLTTLMAELAALSGSPNRLRLTQVLGAILAGAWLGSVALTHWSGAAPIVPALILAGVVAIAVARFGVPAPAAPEGIA